METLARSGKGAQREGEGVLFAASGKWPPLRIYRYRWLVAEFVTRDLRLRYRESFLGFLWTLLNPVLYTGIYALVFGLILKVGTERYPVFLLTGLIPWTWFLGSITQGTTAIPDGRMYVGKTAFPIEVLIAVPVLSNLINFLFSLPLLFAVMLIFGAHVGWSIVLLPVAILLQYALTYGLLLVIATYAVFFRDLQQIITLLLSFLFFLNPIFYTLDRIPEPIRSWTLLDPFTPLLGIYRAILYRGHAPAPSLWLLSSAFAVAALLLGQWVFERHRDAFGEYL